MISARPLEYPGWKPNVHSPILCGVHAPGERLDLVSLEKFVALLEDVLVNYQ